MLVNLYDVNVYKKQRWAPNIRGEELGLYSSLIQTFLSIILDNHMKKLTTSVSHFRTVFLTNSNFNSLYHIRQLYKETYHKCAPFWICDPDQIKFKLQILSKLKIISRFSLMICWTFSNIVNEKYAKIMKSDLKKNGKISLPMMGVS